MPTSDPSIFPPWGRFGVSCPAKFAQATEKRPQSSFKKPDYGHAPNFQPSGLIQAGKAAALLLGFRDVPRPFSASEQSPPSQAIRRAFQPGVLP